MSNQSNNQDSITALRKYFETLKPQTPVVEKSEGFEIGKTYTVDGITFIYQDPKQLTREQKQFVMRFMRQIKDDLSPARDYMYFIDLIPMVQGRKISFAKFDKITGIGHALSTWNNLHEHNL